MLFTRRFDDLLGLNLTELNSNRPNLNHFHITRRSFGAILLRECLSIPIVIFTMIVEPEKKEKLSLCNVRISLVYVGSVTTFLYSKFMSSHFQPLVCVTLGIKPISFAVCMPYFVKSASVT